MGVKEGLPAEAARRSCSASPGAGQRVRDGLRARRSRRGPGREPLPAADGKIAAILLRGSNDALATARAAARRGCGPTNWRRTYRDLETQLLLPLGRAADQRFLRDDLLRRAAQADREAGAATPMAPCRTTCSCAEGGIDQRGAGASASCEMAALAARRCRGGAGTFCKGTQAAIEPARGSVRSFERSIAAYLEKFGDRCLEELKLESVTLHDDPLMLLRSVGSAGAAPGAHGSAGPTQRAAATRAAETSGCNASSRGSRFAGGSFFVGARQRAARVRDRENLRFERTRLFGRVRRIFVELGSGCTRWACSTTRATSSTQGGRSRSASSTAPAVTTDLKALVRLRKAGVRRATAKSLRRPTASRRAVRSTSATRSADRTGMAPPEGDAAQRHRLLSRRGPRRGRA